MTDYANDSSLLFHRHYQALGRTTPLLTLIRIASSFSAADPRQRWTISGYPVSKI